MYTSLLQMLHSATQPGSRPAAASSGAAATNRSSSSSSSPSASSTSSSSSTSDPGVDLTQTFLQLLTVQLKNQSPLDPLDPNAFVAQLAQFDSLGELTQIQELMQTLVNDVTTTSNPASGTAANGNSISSYNLNAASH